MSDNKEYVHPSTGATLTAQVSSAMRATEIIPCLQKEQFIESERNYKLGVLHVGCIVGDQLIAKSNIKRR